MKAPSSTLFKLIKKMTTEEKKYFSRFIFLEKRDAKANLLHKLFCAMDGMKVYEEASLKKMFNNSLKGKSFKTYKSLLKEKLLKSLSAQGSYTCKEVGLYKKLERAEILASKGLEKEAFDALNDITETLNHESQFTINDLITQGQIIASKLSLMMNMSGNNTKIITQLSEDGVAVAEKLKYGLDAFNYSKQLCCIGCNSLLLQTRNEKEHFNKISSQFEEIVLTYNEKEPLIITEARAAKALIENDFETALTYFQKISCEYSLRYHYSERNSSDDFIFFGKLIFAFINISILTKRPEYLSFSLMKSFHAYSKPPSVVGSEFYYTIYLYGYLIKKFWLNDEVETEKTLNTISKLSIWEQTEPNMMLYRCVATHVALVYYSYKKFNTALSWLRKVTSTHYKHTEYIHYVEFCKLFELIVEYEFEITTNNILSKSFIYSVESAFEQIRKHPERDRSYAAVFILFFKKVTEYTIETKKQELIEKLKNDLEILSNTGTSKYFNTLFDFNFWVEKLETENKAKAA